MAKVAELTKEQAALRDAINNFKPKERKFLLVSEGTPVSWSLSNRHTRYKKLTWYDPIKEEERELRYCTNQSSVFVDEQKGVAILGDILFVDGVLTVPPTNVALQKLLLFFHPDKEVIYREFDPEKAAARELDELIETTKAGNVVLDMDITDLEAIARIALGSHVDNMRTNEIRRDMLQWVRNNSQNAKEFFRLADNKDIKLRNLAQRAIEHNIIALRDSGTTVFFVDNDEVIMKVPFGENAILALAAYMQTDKGIKVMDKIALKLTQ